MNIYLDIDGVLITKRENVVSNYSAEFIASLLERHNVYWLSIHCPGDSRIVLEYLSGFFKPEIIEIMKKIKPTSFNICKTEGIDFSQEFLWFDDHVGKRELEILKKQNKLDRLIMIDLEKDPDQLKNFLKI